MKKLILCLPVSVLILQPSVLFMVGWCHDFCIFVLFVLIDFIFKISPTSIVLKCCFVFPSSRKLWCTLRWKYVSGKFHSGMTYSAIGCEFNVNESTIPTNQGSLNRNTENKVIHWPIDELPNSSVLTNYLWWLYHELWEVTVCPILINLQCKSDINVYMFSWKLLSQALPDSFCAPLHILSQSGESPPHSCFTRVPIIPVLNFIIYSQVPFLSCAFHRHMLKFTLRRFMEV